MQTLILGIGNTLLSDEGVGVHAVRFLQEQHTELPGTRFIDGGTLSFTLATEIEQADNLIVIDAAQLHADPGTVKTFVDDEMDQFLGKGNKRSVHEVSLLDLLHISRMTGHFPTHRALIGIQPQKLDWGEAPTESVSAAIPLACEQAVDQIRSWQQ
ncbi:MAG: HyaD/HybD family hydrogenase maturation endopeptidase [Thioalkalispiraceae bacterium]|jgi:hydrogenase maturation protease